MFLIYITKLIRYLISLFHIPNLVFLAGLIAVLLCPVCIVIAIPNAAQAQPPIHTIIDWYARLRSAQLNPNSVAEVKDIYLVRANASFYLESGELFFSTPVNDRVLSAVFKGKGKFSFDPPNEQEKGQIERFLDKSTVDVPIQYIYFQFSDSTYSELMSQVRKVKKTRKLDRDVSEFYTSKVNYLYDEQYYDTAYRILWDLVQTGGDGYFFADCRTLAKDRMNAESFQFTNDPRAFENVALTHYREHRAGTPHNRISNFRTDTSMGYTEPRDPSEQDFRLPEYELDVTISGDGNAEVTADLLIEDRRGGTQFLIFNLAKKLQVKSVLDEDNKPVLFFRQNDKDRFLRLVLNNPMKSGEKRLLRVVYNGEILKRFSSGQWILQDFLYWYPRFGNNFRALYTLNFHIPHKNTLVASGQCLNEWEDKDYKHSMWRQEEPVFIISFNLGDFVIDTYAAAELPEIKIFSQPQFSGSERKILGEEVCRSMEFYQETFVPYPFRALSISEVPQKPDIGYPALINISSLTIVEKEEYKKEIILAHEAAHQWWGHLVSWRTYHDVWLSEGLAEYSAHLYLEQKDAGAFEREIKGKSERILSELKSIIKAGPIHMGSRLSYSLESVRDYNTLIYHKSAYVLHMLRMLLRDFATMDDSRFYTMLKEFAQKFSWRNASTTDLQAVAEIYYGATLQWFFDQWIYGTAIPVYYLSYSIEKEKDNTWSISGRVRQTDVPEDFRMTVPLTIIGKDTWRKTELVLIDKGHVQFRINEIPEEPSEVIFNDFNSVLCQVRLEPEP